MAPIGRILAAASVAGAYLGVLRPWQLRWGSTDEEIEQGMPGDDLVDRPTFKATRAVTVEAAPEHIWPWLLQIGINRAGWYSYDWLDNLGRPSATEIIPELQDLPKETLRLFHQVLESGQFAHEGGSDPKRLDCRLIVSACGALPVVRCGLRLRRS